MRRARIGVRDGVIRGVLWHQDEDDSVNFDLAAAYERLIVKLVADMRRSLDSPALAFVAAELGNFIPADIYPARHVVNAALRRMPEIVPMTACVSADGLEVSEGKGAHFSAASACELGRRYARAMLEFQSRAAGGAAGG